MAVFYKVTQIKIHRPKSKEAKSKPQRAGFKNEPSQNIRMVIIIFTPSTTI